MNRTAVPVSRPADLVTQCGGRAQTALLKPDAEALAGAGERAATGQRAAPARTSAGSRNCVFPEGMARANVSRLDIPIARTVALVGMMGVGKTTIGRRLAPKLGLAFVDADEEIEKAAGMSVSDLFAAHGEESFRRGEAQVIDRLISGPPVVLATGGGALTNPATRKLIAERTFSVWLKADVDTILERATRRNTRPLLKDGDPRATLSRLLAEREPYYAAADIAIDAEPGPQSRTIAEILEAMRAVLAEDDPKDRRDRDGRDAP